MTITQCIIMLSLMESWYTLRVPSRISQRSERRRVVYRGPPHGFWGWNAITQVQGRSTHREWHHPLNTHPMYYSPLPEWSVHLLVKIRYFTTQNSVSRLFILNFICIIFRMDILFELKFIVDIFNSTFCGRIRPPPTPPTSYFILFR